MAAILSELNFKTMPCQNLNHAAAVRYMSSTP